MISWGAKLLTVSGIWVAGSSLLIIGKSSFYDKDKIVLGNYHGYMSPDVASELSSQYQVSFDYFENDHSVEHKLNRGVYDMSIVSTSVLSDLKDKKLISEVDWKSLNIKKSGSSDVSDAAGAKELFSDSVQKIVGDDLLKYGIPYFLNKLSFCYTGTKITALNNKVSWKTLVENIAKEERFKSKWGLPSLALIDDPRTVLSLARLVEEKDNVNPENGDYKNGAQDILKSYLKIKDAGLNKEKLGDNFLFFDANSSNLIDSLASGSVSGAFMYNGDCLYASQGGNFGESKVAKKDNFHIVEMDKDIYFLDFLTFSSKLSESKKSKAYEIAKELLFYYSNNSSESSSTLNYLEKNEEEYKYTPTKNFDYVQYTPVLKEPLNKIKSEYFQKSDELCDEKKKMLTIDISNDSSSVKNFYENKISEKIKSDMFSAFEKFKLSL